MENEIRYFNFPIVLLEGFLVDHKKCLVNIFDYAIYEYCQKYDKDINEAAKYFGVKIGNPSRTVDNGMMLHDSIQSNLAMVGINKNLYFDFYSNQKKEFDKVVLLAYLAFKSIIGNKSHCKSYHNMVFARMDGKNKSIKDVGELSKELVRYYKRTQREKIYNLLQLDWSLVYYTFRGDHGFNVSFKLNFKSLMEKIEDKRDKNRIKKLKDAQNKIKTGFKNQHLK